MSLAGVLVGPGIPLQLDVLLVQHAGVCRQDGRHGDDVVADHRGHSTTHALQARRPVVDNGGDHLVESGVGDVVEAEVIAAVCLQAETGL